MVHPNDAAGLSVVCDCGISFSMLTISRVEAQFSWDTDCLWFVDDTKGFG